MDWDSGVMVPQADPLFLLPLTGLCGFRWGSHGVLPKPHHSECHFLLKEAEEPAEEEEVGKEAIVMVGVW